MKKSSSGLAGAVRIQQMKMDDITRAEKHGKRLDKSSRARAINPEGPLTTTGLNLNELYRKHVEGAFVPRAKSKAMHVIVQFPKELVDGEDAEYMLRHARAFVERVFGRQAIFADRVDRDEKSRQVVDVFVAPKYFKETKHEIKRAVSMSLDLKALARKYGHHTNPQGTGRALQDAWVEYLRKDMGFDRAQRGTPKVVAGSDWKSAEELRVEELDDLRTKAHTEAAVAEQARHEAEASKAAAIADAAAAREIRSDAIAREKESRDLINQQKEQLEEAERALQRKISQIEVEQADARRLLANAQEDARRVRELALQDAKKERARALEESRLNDARLSLLERAVDDENGLDLRPTPDAFTLNETRMSDRERQLFHAEWPQALRRIGRELALILERIRNFWDSVRRKDEELRLKQLGLEQRERNVATGERELGAKAVTLNQTAKRQSQESHRLEVGKAELSRREELMGKSEAQLIKRANEIALKDRETREWAEIASKLLSGELYLDNAQSPRLRDDQTDRVIDGPLAERFSGAKPGWVKQSIQACQDLQDVAKEVAEVKQRVLDREIELKQLLSKAGPILSAEAKAVAREINDKVNVGHASAVALGRLNDPSRAG